jgi:hypothetical protein
MTGAGDYRVLSMVPAFIPAPERLHRAGTGVYQSSASGPRF